MGNASSNWSCAHVEDVLDPKYKYHAHHVDHAAVKLMLPVYYSSAALTREDILMASNSWDLIESGAVPEYIRLQQCTPREEFPFTTAAAWFSNVYFSRLFDVHPLSRSMFLDPRVRQRFLSSFMGFVFTAVTDKANFKKKFSLLAITHCHRGVKAIEYGIIGEVMFWSLRFCLRELYDKDTHNAWVKLFSTMLAVIIPVAVRKELDCDVAQKSRAMGNAQQHAYSHKLSVSDVSASDNNRNSIGSNIKAVGKLFTGIGITDFDVINESIQQPATAAVTWECAHKRGEAKII